MWLLSFSNAFNFSLLYHDVLCRPLAIIQIKGSKMPNVWFLYAGVVLLLSFVIVGCSSLGELSIMSKGRIATFLIPLLCRLRNEKRDHWWQDELGKATALLKVMWWQQPSPAANITWFIWNWTITHTLYSEFIVILPTPTFNLDDLFLKNFLTRKWQMLIEF